MDSESAGLGSSDAPRPSDEEFSTPARSSLPTLREPIASAENADKPIGRGGRLVSLFSQNSDRQVAYDPGWGRSQRVLAREREFTERRRRETAELASRRRDAMERNPTPEKQSRLDKTLHQVRRLEERAADIEAPTRYPSREIPPPPGLYDKPPD